MHVIRESQGRRQRRKNSGQKAQCKQRQRGRTQGGLGTLQDIEYAIYSPSLLQVWWFLYLFAAKSLQSCPTLCDPIDGSPPGSPVPGILPSPSPSLGFSRQEHWSGLPFPSPMHESEKWKWSCSVLSNSERLHRRQLTMLHLWDFPGKSTGVGCHCLLWYLFTLT